MNTRYFLPMAVFASLIFACGMTQAARQRLPSNTTNEAQLLREAYAALQAADHDYHGHRIKAMKQIERASIALGEPMRGDGKGHEPQGESDSQLRKAQGLLEGITSASARHGRAGTHIERAIKELSIALSIK